MLHHKSASYLLASVVHRQDIHARGPQRRIETVLVQANVGTQVFFGKDLAMQIGNPHAYGTSCGCIERERGFVSGRVGYNLSGEVSGSIVLL